MSGDGKSRPSHAGSRHKARQRALTLLFEAESRDVDPVELAENRRDYALELARSGEGGMPLVSDYANSTGHGVGIDIHEHPWVRTGSQESIVPGTVFTVEPGIYLPDRGGVRIENTYVLEEDGNVRSLQAFSAELLLV